MIFFLYLNHSLGQNAATGADMVELRFILFFWFHWLLAFSLLIDQIIIIIIINFIHVSNKIAVSH